MSKEIDPQAVYVTDIPRGTTTHELKEFFKPNGKLVSAFTNTNRETKKQWGIVIFKDPANAQAVIKRGLVLFKGNICVVQEKTVRKRPHKPPLKEISVFSPGSERMKAPNKAQGLGAAPFAAHPAASRIAPSAHSHAVPLPAPLYDAPPKFIPPNSCQEDVPRKQYSGQVQSLTRAEGQCRGGTVLGPITEIKSEHSTAKSKLDIQSPHKASKVVRLEGIPSDWSAERLYHHLSSSKLPIKSCFVYDDYDEFKQRQGMLQLESFADAQLLCNRGYLETALMKLTIVPSAVSSIGPVRKSYAGKYTAYTKEDASEPENIETYGYSVAEPFEPFNTNAKSIAFPPRAFGHGSPKSASLSPLMNGSCESDSVTPISIHEDPIVPHVKVQDPGVGTELQRDTVFATARSGTAIKYPQQAFRSFHGPCQANDLISFQPGIVVSKPSTTVIMENLNKSHVKDAKSLAIWMEQFGEVRSADLVPLSPSEFRAYISFWHPGNADFAFRNIMAGGFMQHNLQVRLA